MSAAGNRGGRPGPSALQRLPRLPAWVPALVRAGHPGPCVAIAAVATLIAVAAGRGAGSASVGAAVLVGQLSVGWSNDWFDRERDRVAGRGDKPLVTGAVEPGWVRLASVVALVACIPLSMLSGVEATVANLAIVGLGWAYNVGLKNSSVSVVPFLLAFGLLPAVVTLGPPLHRAPPAWAVAGAALLGAGAHFTNTLRDLRSDARAGVSGLPHRLGARGSTITAAALLAIGAVTVALGPPGPPDALALVGLAVASALVAALVGAALTGRPSLAFELTVATAVTVAATLVVSGSKLG